MQNKIKNKYNKKSTGFSIIEIILSISLFSIITLGAISSALYGESAQIQSGARKRATLIADQTVEILRAIRDSSSRGFGAITISGRHQGLGMHNGAWTLIADPDTVDDYFLRTVDVTLADDGIAKKITTTVCWPATDCPSAGDSVSIVTYLTDWRSGGTGTAGGIKVAVAGDGQHAYMITDHNSLEVFNITNPALNSWTPMGTASLGGDINGLPTNLFYSAYGGQKFVYVSSSNPSAGFQIVNVSDPTSPQVYGTAYVTVEGDSNSTVDSVWADTQTGEAFLLAHNSDSSVSEIFMVDARDPSAPNIILLPTATYSVANQVIGGLAVGDISSQPKMCTTAGGSVATGYSLYCYDYNFDFSNPTPAPSLAEDGVLSTSHGSWAPSHTIAIYNNDYYTTPGGQISKNDSTPVTISSNDIYDMSLTTREGRPYAYLAVPSDTTGFKEVDIFDINNPVIITARNTVGALYGVVYDSTTSTPYAFGSDSIDGFVSFLPTTVGINMTPFDGIDATTIKGSDFVHCLPVVSPSTDHGCPVTYRLTNVSSGNLAYTISSDESWVVLSGSGNTLSPTDHDDIIASVDVAEVNTANLSEGTHSATITLTYGSTHITRTVSLIVNPAVGTKVRAQ
ncbi:MAG: hypothetical protein V4439_00250 [Patescibacteria group bacterium]